MATAPLKVQALFQVVWPASHFVTSMAFRSAVRLAPNSAAKSLRTHSLVSLFASDRSSIPSLKYIRTSSAIVGSGMAEPPGLGKNLPAAQPRGHRPADHCSQVTANDLRHFRQRHRGEPTATRIAALQNSQFTSQGRPPFWPLPVAPLTAGMS